MAPKRVGTIHGTRVRRGGAMLVVLFVTASVAVLAGLVGLMAAHMPRTTGRRQVLRAAGMSR
jgi:hypothetical protein